MSEANNYLIVLTSDHYTGKTFLSQIMGILLEEYGFGYSVHVAREIIDQMLRDSGLGITRENIVNYGQLASDHSILTGRPGFIAQNGMNNILKALEAKQTHHVHLVESVYHPHDVVFWRKFGLDNGLQTEVLTIDCPHEIRVQNASRRHPSLSLKEIEEEIARVDRAERTGVPGHQQLDECIRMADYAVANDGDPSSLKENVIIFLNQFLFQ